jgi:hypothetical protein
MAIVMMITTTLLFFHSIPLMVASMEILNKLVAVYMRVVDAKIALR